MKNETFINQRAKLEERNNNLESELCELKVNKNIMQDKITKKDKEYQEQIAEIYLLEKERENYEKYIKTLNLKVDSHIKDIQSINDVALNSC